MTRRVYANYVATPQIEMKTEGFADLAQALHLLAELHKYDAVVRNVMIKAAKNAMQPVLDSAIYAAEYDESNTGMLHMRDTIRLDARVPRENDRKSMYVTPTDAVIAVVSVKKSAVSLANEFGTKKVPASPFLRPSLERNRQQVISNLKAELGALVDAYIQKLPRLKK
jgi:HK97 gp10 family phage protein